MNATEINTSRVEDLLNEECKCESDHRSEGNRYCSEVVTHRLEIHCLSQTKLVCWNQFRYSTQHMGGIYTCSLCEKPSEDCWTIIPV